MSTRSKVRISTALVGAMVILATACGGGDDGASVDSVPPTSSTTTSSSTTTIATTTSSTTEAPELSGDPAFDASSSVSTVGIDELIFGMTVADAETALNSAFVRLDPDGDDECHQIRPAGGPVGVELTVTAGTIERVDITNGEITTRSGAGVGSTEAELADLFGERVTTQPNPDGSGNVVTFTPVDEGDNQFRVIFETDGTAVTSFRSGRVPIIEPTTPCEASATG